MNEDDLPGMLRLQLGVLRQEWLHTVDARVWADEWAKTIAEHPGIATDPGAMLGWFANAIMAGYDAERARLNDA